jgi:hypothetical protein
MGAGASSNHSDETNLITYQHFTEFVTKQKSSEFLKICDLEATFYKYQNPETKCITMEKCQELLMKTDIFLTYNLGIDELQRNNHDRVSKINLALRLRGFESWFDEQYAPDRTNRKMMAGVDNASVILVFVTKQYIGKVNSNNPDDICHKEFKYASNAKSSKMMIPIVMETAMKEVDTTWDGLFKTVFDGISYIDYSKDDDFDDVVDRITNEILSRSEMLWVLKNSKNKYSIAGKFDISIIIYLYLFSCIT